jgi:(R,R)-butanediol dehydrogenase / meso-butanediol dehydrogenase / diacetyl reductase
VRAAVIGADGGFHVETLDDPTPGQGEMVLRVTGCGICGSDLKARPAMPPGTVMGHELCGEIVAVGSGTAGQWREGTRAAVLPVFSCGTCDWCRAGDVAHCAEAALMGLGGCAGGFAELVRARADLAFPLPADLPTAWGPLVEPFAVGLHAARMAGITPTDDVLVIGAGPVGLTTAWWARDLGARSVTVSDPVAPRRHAAPAFGATGTIDPSAAGLGGPYDVVIECVGKPGLLGASADAARTKGRIVVAGVCAEPDPFVPLVALLKELTVRFAVYYRPDEFRAAIDAFATGRVDPTPLVTRTVGFADLDEVFASLATSPRDLKVLVDPAVQTPPDRPQEAP